jgi:RNA polymerase sigma factor (sigma-70 family)
MAGTPLSFVLRQFHRLVRAGPDEETADGRLLQRFVEEHEEAAFATLVGRHGPMVLAACRRLLDEHDAEDAFQATFLILARQAHTLKRRPSVGAWLHRVACRVALRCRQVEARRRGAQPLTQAMPSPDPAAEASRTELRALMDEELQELPEKYRAPLVLCYLEGATYTEAARALGCAEGTVSGRLARARMLLRRRLTQRGLPVAESVLLTALAQGAASAVPSALATATLRTAVQVSAGAAPTVSGSVLALAEAAGQTLGAVRMATPVLMALAVTVLSVGVGLALHRAGAAGNGSEVENPGVDAAVQVGALKEGKGTAQATPRAGEGPVDVYGDPLPKGAVARLGTLRLRGERPTRAVRLSHDGKVLAWWGQTGGTVHLAEVATGRELRRLDTESDAVLAVRFNEGRRALTVVSASTTVLRGWVFGDEKRLLWTLNHDFNVLSAAFGPDGQHLAVATHDGWIRLRRTSTGHELKKWKGFAANRTALAFSPNGRQLAAGCGPALAGGGKQQPGVVRLWEVGSGRGLGELPGMQAVAGLAFAPDGKTLAVGYQPQYLWLWDLATQTRVQSGFSPDGNIPAFAPEGKLLAVGSTADVERFGFPGLVRHAILSANGPVYGLTFSADSKTLAAGVGVYGQGDVQVWDAATGKERLLFPRHSDAVNAVAFTSDGKRIVSASKDHTVRLWDSVSGKAVYHVEEPAEGTPVFALDRDGRLLATASGATVRVRKAATGEVASRFAVPGQRVQSLVFIPSAEQRLGVLYHERGGAGEHPWSRLTERDPQTGKPLHEIPLLTQGLRGAALVGEGRWLAVLGVPATTVRVWDRRQAQVAWTLVAGDAEAGRRPGPKGNAPNFLFLASSPLDRVVTAVADDRTVRSWELTTGKQIHHFKTPCATTALAVSPRGKLIAVAGDIGEERPVICVHETSTGKVLRQLRGHRAAVLAVAFNPDGARLATGSADTSVLVWDVADLRPGAAPEKKDAEKKQLEVGFPADIEAAWESLAGTDAARAFKAIRRLVESRREAVALIGQRLRPAAAATPRRVAALLKDLDSQKEEVHQRAEADLELLGQPALAHLRQALTQKPGARLRKRLEELIRNIDGPTIGPSTLRAFRALEVLETIATPEARRVLEALAGGAPGARLTREAETALERLRKARGQP